jgi:hypothetical protein
MRSAASVVRTLAVLLLAGVSIVGCRLGDGQITAFSFLQPPATGVIDHVQGTIRVVVPPATRVNQLVATFAQTGGTRVEVNGVAQRSGVSVQDFSAPVSYVVVSPNGSRTTYVVTVSLAPLNWTWMGGSPFVNRSGIYGDRGVAAASSAPGAREYSTSWTDPAGRFWLFGGFGLDSGGSLMRLNDLWRYQAGAWTWVSGSKVGGATGTYGSRGVADPGNAPGAREGSAAWVDAAADLWLFGGVGFTPHGGFGRLGDLWRFDGASWTWMAGPAVPDQPGSYGTRGVAAPANLPGAREVAATCPDGHGGAWMFGGDGIDSLGLLGALADLWRFDGSGWTWVAGASTRGSRGAYGTRGVPATSNAPGARFGAACWTDAGGRLWLFGGFGMGSAGLGGLLDDLWRFEAGQWTWVGGSDRPNPGSGTYGTQGVPARSNQPGPRESALAWTDPGGALWLFGGVGRDAGTAEAVLDDLWKWDGSNWTWVSGSRLALQRGVYGTRGASAPGHVPGARQPRAGWIDGSGSLWLLGGSGVDASGAIGLLNDLWHTGVGSSVPDAGDKAITAFSFAGLPADGAIDQAARTIAVGVPAGTDPTRLVATFTTTGASVSVGGVAQVSGATPNDFTRPLPYLVTAADGTTATYTVTVVPAPSPAKALTAFSIVSPPAAGAIDEAAGAVSVTVPHGTALTALVASFTTTGVSVEVGGVEQVSGVTPNDFTRPVDYLVTAEDGSTATYTVTVAVAPSAEKALTAFSIVSPPAAGAIDEAAGTVSVTVPHGTALTALVASFIATGVSVEVDGVEQASGITANDFTRPVDYVVTAEDGSEAVYTVSVTVTAAPSAAKALTAFSFASPPATGAIDEGAKAIAVAVPAGTDRTGLLASFTTTGASVTVRGVAQVSGVTPNDFTGPVGYLVAAEDGSTALYTVTVTEQGGQALGAWTWVSGASTRDQLGVYGTRGVPGAGNLPGGRIYSTAWMDGRDHLWVYGGMGYDSAGPYAYSLSDLWTFDGSAWTWVGGSDHIKGSAVRGTKGVADPGNTPGMRQGAPGWIDASDHLWLFGGGCMVDGGDATCNDLWRYDGASWAWMSGSDLGYQPGVYGTRGVADPSNVPGARSVAVSWTGGDGTFWLFGGAAGWDSTGTHLQLLDDLWKFDGTSWTWVSGASTPREPGTYGTRGTPSPANVPGAREFAATAVGAAGDLWLFGGSGLDAAGTEAVLNDLWRFDGNSWTWVSGSSAGNATGFYGSKGFASPGNVPGARVSPALWVDQRGALWLFGGFGNDSTGARGRLNDLWKFDGTSWTWMGGAATLNGAASYGTKGVPGPDDVPGARQHSAFVTDHAGRPWLLGGEGLDAAGLPAGLLDDLWRFDPP